MHLSSRIARLRVWGFLGFLSALPCIFSGCAAPGPKVYVPHQPTAKMQYAYANSYRARQNLILRDVSNSGRWSDTRKALEKAFAMVIELYPEDLQYTPLAKLEIAEIRAGLDFSAGEGTSRRELRRGIRLFQGLQEDYPEIHYIHAKAMLDEALTWKELRRFDRLQALLVAIIEIYGDSEEPEIRLIVAGAKAIYQQVYVD